VSREVATANSQFSWLSPLRGSRKRNTPFTPG
jgi:hypothetical protein